MSIEIRQATEDEWNLVRDVRLTALMDAPYAFGSTYERERNFDERTWRDRLSNPDGPTFLAFEGGVPVGIDGVFSQDGVPYLVAMWVNPRARRSGVAAALTEAVIDWARARGAERLVLSVAEGNDIARSVYERVGFRVTGRTEPLGSDPTRQTVEMALDLR